MMKKSLIVFLLLLALPVLSFGRACSELEGTQNSLEYREKIISGDRSSLEGIELSIKTDCDNYLIWENELDLTALETKPQFSFSQNRVYPERDRNYYGLNIYASSNSSYISSGISDIDFYKLRELNLPSEVCLALAAVASRTGNGSSRTETIKTNDYAEYYELIVDGYIPASMYVKNENEEYLYRDYAGLDSPVSTKINDKFKIRIPDSDTANITISKDEAGNIYEYSYESSSLYSFNSRSATSDKLCFFEFQLETYDAINNKNERIDGSGGIWVIPYRALKGEELSAVGDDILIVDMDSMRLVYPIDNETEIADISISEDSSQILLTAVKDGITYLEIVDIESGRLLQHLDLYEGDLYFNGLIYCQGGILYQFGPGELVLVTENNGLYRIGVTADLPEDIEGHCALSAAWSGERLVIVASLHNFISKERCCDFKVFVIDKNGSFCQAEYFSGLYDSISYTSRLTCRPWTLDYETGISISFN